MTKPAGADFDPQMNYPASQDGADFPAFVMCPLQTARLDLSIVVQIYLSMDACEFIMERTISE
jgi:hypothetical protein